MQDLEYCFRILEINSDATLEEIKQAYSDLINIWHPSKFKNDLRLYKKAENKINEINKAYDNIVKAHEDKFKNELFTSIDEKIEQIHTSTPDLHSDQIFEREDLSQSAAVISDGNQNQGTLESNADEIVTSSDSVYKGVAGWLLFLCVSLTIITPFVSVLYITAIFYDLSITFKGIPAFRMYAVIDIPITLFFTIYSVYAGSRLWYIKPNAVKTAKQYLLAVLLFDIAAFFLLFMFVSPSETKNAMLYQSGKLTFRDIIYVIIWYSYLTISKRVKATYNHEYAAMENDNSQVVPPYPNNIIAENSNNNSLETVSIEPISHDGSDINRGTIKKRKKVRTCPFCSKEIDTEFKCKYCGKFII